MSVIVPCEQPEAMARMRMLVITQHAEMMGKYGMPLTRNAPTLKQIRSEFGITARTWEEAGPQMRALYEQG